MHAEQYGAPGGAVVVRWGSAPPLGSPGLALVSASVAAANLGAGVRTAQGNVAPLLAHCVLAGNLGGGLVCEAAAGVASSSVFFPGRAAKGKKASARKKTAKKSRAGKGKKAEARRSKGKTTKTAAATKAVV